MTAAEPLEHPRIATESREDIEFLKDQLRASASASIKAHDRHSALTPEQKDALAKYSENYINEIFRLASGNITINGLSYNDAFKTVDEYEPFDEQLRIDTESLMSTTSSLRTHLASIRASLPLDILALETKKCDEEGVQELESVLENEKMKMETVWKNVGDKVAEAAEDISGQTTELRKDGETAISLLNSLQKTIAPTSDKWFRAGRVLQDLGSSGGMDENQDEDDEEDVGDSMDVDGRNPVTPRRARSGLIKTLKMDI